MLTLSGLKLNALGSSQAYTCQVPEQMVMRKLAEDGGDDDKNEVMTMNKYWGTWEELVLGAAVIKLGTKDWNAVASLLQSKTPYPSLFTCEECKAKYEELQQRYSGCNAWFEELRNRRVAELKSSLAESETSIGSLESKIELLKAEKTCSNAADCSSNRAESESSPLQLRKSEAISEFSGKDVPKDGLSAGSYTEETGPKWSSSYFMHGGDVPEDNKIEVKPLVLEAKASRSGEWVDSFTEAARSEQPLMFLTRKKRTQNKRKRRIGNANQMGVEEEHSVSPGNVGGNDDDEDDISQQKRDLVKMGGSCSATCAGSMKESVWIEEDLTEVFMSVLENDQASIFLRKMDSQKRTRYRKVVRQHRDLEMIKMRITSKSISTVGELLRDLLLLANNALVFYSKTTREYKCAVVLRELVNKKLRAGVNFSVSRPLVEHLRTHDDKLPAEPDGKPPEKSPANHVDKLPAKLRDPPADGKPLDDNSLANHVAKLPAKLRNGHPNKVQSSMALPASTAPAPAPASAPATIIMIATRGPETTTNNKGNREIKIGRESMAMMESSLVKVKRPKGRPPGQAKKDQASALAVLAADTTKFSAIKPRKRHRAALN